jgi:hypothetical protein
MIVGSIIKKISFIWAGLWIALASFVLTWFAFPSIKDDKTDNKKTEKQKNKAILGIIIHLILIVACSVIIRFGLI